MTMKESEISKKVWVVLDNYGMLCLGGKPVIHNTLERAGRHLLDRIDTLYREAKAYVKDGCGNLERFRDPGYIPNIRECTLWPGGILKDRYGVLYDPDSKLNNGWRVDPLESAKADWELWQHIGLHGFWYASTPEQKTRADLAVTAKLLHTVDNLEGMPERSDLDRFYVPVYMKRVDCLPTRLYAYFGLGERVWGP